MQKNYNKNCNKDKETSYIMYLDAKIYTDGKCLKNYL